MFWKVKYAGEFKTVLVNLLKISSLNSYFFLHWGELGSRFQFDFKALTFQSWLLKKQKKKHFHFYLPG